LPASTEKTRPDGAVAVTVSLESKEDTSNIRNYETIMASF